MPLVAGQSPFPAKQQQAPKAKARGGGTESASFEQAHPRGRGGLWIKKPGGGQQQVGTQAQLNQRLAQLGFSNIKAFQNAVGLDTSQGLDAATVWALQSADTDTLRSAMAGVKAAAAAKKTTTTTKKATSTTKTTAKKTTTTAASTTKTVTTSATSSAAGQHAVDANKLQVQAASDAKKAGAAKTVAEASKWSQAAEKNATNALAASNLAAAVAKKEPKNAQAQKDAKAAAASAKSAATAAKSAATALAGIKTREHTKQQAFNRLRLSQRGSQSAQITSRFRGAGGGGKASSSGSGMKLTAPKTSVRVLKYHAVTPTWRPPGEPPDLEPRIRALTPDPALALIEAPWSELLHPRGRGGEFIVSEHDIKAIGGSPWTHPGTGKTRYYLNNYHQIAGIKKQPGVKVFWEDNHIKVQGDLSDEDKHALGEGILSRVSALPPPKTAKDILGELHDATDMEQVGKNAADMAEGNRKYVVAKVVPGDGSPTKYMASLSDGRSVIHERPEIVAHAVVDHLNDESVSSARQDARPYFDLSGSLDMRRAQDMNTPGVSDEDAAKAWDDMQHAATGEGSKLPVPTARRENDGSLTVTTGAASIEAAKRHGVDGVPVNVNEYAPPDPGKIKPIEHKPIPGDKPTAFESKVCSKCGGEGKIFTYSNVLGGVCFKCGGRGRVLTKKGRAAQSYYNDLLSKRSDELAPGDKIYQEGVPGFTSSKWQTVTGLEHVPAEKVGSASIYDPKTESGAAAIAKAESEGALVQTRPDGSVSIKRAATRIKFDDGTSMDDSPSRKHRVARTADEKRDAIKQAKAYQDTLTQQGVPAKIKKKVQEAAVAIRKLQETTVAFGYGGDYSHSIIDARQTTPDTDQPIWNRAGIRVQTDLAIQDSRNLTQGPPAATTDLTIPDSRDLISQPTLLVMLNEAVEARKAAKDGFEFARARAREQLIRAKLDEVGWEEFLHPRGRGGKFAEKAGGLEAKIAKGWSLAGRAPTRKDEIDLHVSRAREWEGKAMQAHTPEMRDKLLKTATFHADEAERLRAGGKSKTGEFTEKRLSGHQALPDEAYLGKKIETPTEQPTERPGGLMSHPELDRLYGKRITDVPSAIGARPGKASGKRSSGHQALPDEAYLGKAKEQPFGAGPVTTRKGENIGHIVARPGTQQTDLHHPTGEWEAHHNEHGMIGVYPTSGEARSAIFAANRKGGGEPARKINSDAFDPGTKQTTKLTQSEAIDTLTKQHGYSQGDAKDLLRYVDDSAVPGWMYSAASRRDQARRRTQESTRWVEHEGERMLLSEVTKPAPPIPAPPPPKLQLKPQFQKAVHDHRVFKALRATYTRPPRMSGMDDTDTIASLVRMQKAGLVERSARGDWRRAAGANAPGTAPPAPPPVPVADPVGAPIDDPYAKATEGP